MATDYQIWLKGHLDSRWSAWFNGMTISNQANGQAILRGPLADQAIATARDRRTFPPPGQLVDVGGYRIHLH